MAPHIFALAHTQLDDDIVPVSVTGRTPKKKRKRRRKDSTAASTEIDFDIDANIAEERNTTPTLSQTLNRASQASAAFTSLTAAEHLQLRTAGLAPGTPLPGSPFPHARPRPRPNALRAVRRELKDLDLPLAHLDASYYAPAPFKTNEQRTTLREQHVAVLTTLLHTCLQKGDYVRAGRCWALLLRSGNLRRHGTGSSTGIAGMDVRTGERWGIGAELLMRAERPRRKGKSGAVEGYLEYSEEGFEAARKYYDRLIVQYPPGPRSRGTGASTFYAAMFSVWIYEISQKYGLSKYHEPGRSRSASASSEASSQLFKRSRSSSESPSLEPDIINKDDEEQQLHQAGKVAQKLDEILELPTYDTNAEILMIRGMVELWMLDLSGGFAGHKRESLRKAADCFWKARKNGAELGQQEELILKRYGRMDDEDDDEEGEVNNEKQDNRDDKDGQSEGNQDSDDEETDDDDMKMRIGKT